MPPRRIVITTFGSFGDLHPYLAIAIGLQSRGHRVTIATIPFYRAKVESEGIGFYPVGPDFSPDDTAAIRLAMDARKGPEQVIRRMVMPHLRASYAELTEAVRSADLLITHPITYAGPVVAAKAGIAWVSTVLAPLSFFSKYDPPVLAPWIGKLGPLQAPISRAICALGRWNVRSWSEPVRQLRAEFGLPTGADPIFEGQHSPELVLALFSPLLGAPQPDWPPNTHATGFAFYDRLEKNQGLPRELVRFLDSGPAPIVFTLGTSAVMDARDFFVESAKGAAQLGRRAVLLIGRDPANAPADSLPPGIIAADYAPYSEIFPRAAAIVHQGGAGTTAQALRSGRPMLVVPFAHDQPDNAARVVRLGVARDIGRSGYRAPRVAFELRQLLDDPGYAARAAEAGRRVQSEDGVAAACELIEQRLAAVRVATIADGIL
jgi:UDP:flavonoid glycosyltransferase YjiC (YdhE family)